MPSFWLSFLIKKLHGFRYSPQIFPQSRRISAENLVCLTLLVTLIILHGLKHVPSLPQKPPFQESFPALDTFIKRFIDVRFSFCELIHIFTVIGRCPSLWWPLCCVVYCSDGCDCEAPQNPSWDGHLCRETWHISPGPGIDILLDNV